LSAASRDTRPALELRGRRHFALGQVALRAPVDRDAIQIELREVVDASAHGISELADLSRVDIAQPTHANLVTLMGPMSLPSRFDQDPGEVIARSE